MNSRKLEIATNGLLTLSLRDDNHRPWWWYLDIQGEPLYLLGNNCGTCGAIFKRVHSAKLPLTPQQLSTQLQAGLETIPPEVVETVAVLLPKGKYRVELLRLCQEITCSFGCMLIVR
jgi:hypothetical protein